MIDVLLLDSQRARPWIVPVVAGLLAAASPACSEDACNATNHCVRDAAGTPSCEPGYEWTNPDDSEDLTCKPIEQTAACGDGICTGDETIASCPSDCAPLSCPESGFEPNDTKEAAASLRPGSCEGLQLSSGDQDWYEVVVPAGSLATLSIDFDNDAGDLDLLAYEGSGDFLGARYMDESYSGYYRLNETDHEALSVLAGSGGARTYLFKVRGVSGATNTYSLDLTISPFEDGPSCAEIPALAADCERMTEFPFPDPDDGFVSDGYNFDTSDWYYAFFVFANYRFLQLKVILAIRNAIHEVQQRFPGTNPLSLGDMAQRDGKTPGWDIDPDYLRHPDGSHDDGLAIDLAYYQTLPRNDTQWICDVDLDLYTEGDEFCPDGLQHVVDLERTAYFLMTVAQHPDFYDVGVDTAVVSDILDEAQRQTEVEGWFAAETYTGLRNRLESGAGWEYHFDHMHVWFE